MPTTLQNFYKATITRAWTASTGDFNVSVAPTVFPGWIVISPNNSTLREIVKYTAVGTNAYGPFVTVTQRGVGGTTAQAHSVGEPVRMNVTAEHWDQFQTETQDALDVMTDNIANISVTAGNVKASDVVYGNTKLSVAPVSSSDPIALGQNDPVLSTYFTKLSENTLSSPATTLTLSSFSTKKNMKLIILIPSLGSSTQARMRFNSDSGSNYVNVYSSNGGTTGSFTSTSIELSNSGSTLEQYCTLDIKNISNYKKYTAGLSSRGSDQFVINSYWNNTSNQISSIEISLSDSSNLPAGTVMTLLGVD